MGIGFLRMVTDCQSMREDTPTVHASGGRHGHSSSPARSDLRLIEGGARPSTLASRREYARENAPLWLVPERDVPTVLIADADESVLLTLGFALTDEFDLMWARDGEQALRLALIEHPDVVVLDVHMPKLDGYRVAGQIRRNRATCDTPVILLDAHPERIDVLRGLTAGANDYLTKPFEPETLLASIREALESAEIVC
jgi:CheY-like chemotaxis protein